MTRRTTRALVGILLALALLAAACGGDDGGGGGGGSASDDSTVDVADLPECEVDALESATGPVELTFWNAQIANQATALAQVVDEYNASQDQVQVNLENPGGSFEEQQRAYNTAIQGGDLPDMALLEDTQTLALADSGTILPATSCLEAGGEQADLVPTIIDYYSIDGVQYAASAAPQNALLYFNRTHFEDAGLDPDDPPQTLQEMREAAEAIKAAGVAEQPIAYFLAPWIFEFWLTGAGIPFVDNDNGRGDGETTEAVFDVPEVVELLQFFKDLDEDGLLNVFPYRETDLDHYLVMANPDPTLRASMQVESSGSATSVEAFLKGELDPSELSPDGRVIETEDLDLTLDIDAAPFPGIEEPGQVQVGGGVLYLMDGEDPVREAAAWDFVKYFNTPEAQQTMSLVGGSDPVNTLTADLPETQETWETTLSGSWLAISYQQMLDGLDPDFPGPLVGPYTEMRTSIANMLDAVLLDGVEPATAAADAEAEVTAALERYQDQNF
jgi:sn-glycerol 3-phosphate transport system substrate-binding protein